MIISLSESRRPDLVFQVFKETINQKDIFPCQKQLQPNNILNTLHIVKLRVPVLYFLYLLQFSTHALVYVHIPHILVEHVNANELTKDNTSEKRKKFISLDRTGVFLEEKQNNVPGRLRHDAATTGTIHLSLIQNMLI